MRSHLWILTIFCISFIAKENKMKDKLLAAMSEASERVKSSEHPPAKNINTVIRWVGDEKHIRKEKRLYLAMYLTAFGL